MSLSESTINPAQYNPVTNTDYIYALAAIGCLKRQGFDEAAAVVEVAAKEIRKRLEAGQ